MGIVPRIEQYRVCGGALLRLSTSNNLVFSLVLTLRIFLYQPGNVKPACLGGEQFSDFVILLCHLDLGLLSEFNQKAALQPSPILAKLNIRFLMCKNLLLFPTTLKWCPVTGHGSGDYNCLSIMSPVHWSKSKEIESLESWKVGLHNTVKIEININTCLYKRERD